MGWLLESDKDAWSFVANFFARSLAELLAVPGFPSDLGDFTKVAF